MRTLLRILLAYVALASGVAFAQHVELGVFANYDTQDQPNTADHLFGLGGRLDVNVHPMLQLEFEAAYDFKYPHFETTPETNAIVVTNTELGIIHANTGLKVQSPGGSYFAFIKGGVNSYRTEGSVQTITPPLTLTTVTLGDRTLTKGVLYPGAGIGFHAGPLGVRLDVGDEIVWLDGDAKHSLRITFGPTFRF